VTKVGLLKQRGGVIVFAWIKEEDIIRLLKTVTKVGLLKLRGGVLVFAWVKEEDISRL
jgi:predicted NUDIX family NTP pyrophosphohydrolase